MKPHRIAVAVAVLIAAGTSSSLLALPPVNAGNAASQPAPAPLGSGRAAATFSSADRARIERLLTAELQRVIDRQPRIEGQGKVVRVKARLDIQSKALVIDLSRGYLPKFNGGRFEDQQSELANVALSILGGTVGINEVVFLIEGKAIESYFPEAPHPRRVSAMLEPAQPVALHTRR